MNFPVFADMMPHMANSLIERIDVRLKKTGKSDRGASLEATGGPDFIRHLRKGRVTNPRIDSIKKLAEVLQTTSDWLIDGTGNEELTGEGDGTNAPDVSGKPIPSAMLEARHPVPIMGRAAGSVVGASNLADEPIDYVNLPISAAKIKDIYGLWVEGTSMLEKYEPGEPIIIAPHRTVRAKDFVVVQVMQDGELRALVKRYVSRDEGRIKLEQFNPRSFIEIPVEHVHAMHRILSTPELFGMI